MRNTLLAILLLSATGITSAAAPCDLPVRINSGAYGADSVDALRYYNEAVSNNDANTMSDYKKKGLVRDLKAGTHACADGTTIINAWKRIRVTLSNGDSVWMNESSLSKVGWGGL